MRNELIPKVLKEYRKQNNYSVNDVALLLHERSFDVAAKTIYGWESGQAQPSADILLTLCEIYKVADILSAFGYNNEEDIAHKGCLCFKVSKGIAVCTKHTLKYNGYKAEV